MSSINGRSVYAIIQITIEINYLLVYNWNLLYASVDKLANNYVFIRENFFIQSLYKEYRVLNDTVIVNDIYEYVENKFALDII